MPGLFEQFPHTNLHELNLDWIIDLINQFKEELEDSAVLSVNGQTGHVTLYESENVILPPLTNVSSWRLVRMMDGQYVGILFQDGHVWLQQGNSTLKLLTTEDIPTSAGVIAINGHTGIVTLTGRDIAIDDSPDADSIRLALETEHTERVNADNAIQNVLNASSQIIVSTNVGTADRITINDQQIYQIGKLVIGNVRLTVSADINNGEYMLEGLPRGKTTLADGSAFGSASSNRSNAGFALVNEPTIGGIIASQTILSQMYVLGFAYIAE